MSDCCVFTRGEFYIRDAPDDCEDGLLGISCSPNRPFRKIGNVSSGMIGVDGGVVGRENEFNLADPESRMEIRGVNFNASIVCSSLDNLRLSLLSDKIEPRSGDTTEEFCFHPENADSQYFFLKNRGIDPDSVDVSIWNDLVKLEDLTEDVDYLLNSGGIQIISTDYPIDANVIKISYEFNTAGFHEIEFLTKSPKYKEILFRGINYGESEALFDAQLFRVLLAPITETDLITRDEFLTLNLSGVVEKRLGKWFTFTKQEQ